MVSVIVPTLDRPDTLRQAIESILQQTYRDFEIIVVNDGGRDVAALVQSLERTGASVRAPSRRRNPPPPAIRHRRGARQVIASRR
jgi:glycosyltransferase involved in cell wall biosynthesis